MGYEVFSFWDFVVLTKQRGKTSIFIVKFEGLIEKNMVQSNFCLMLLCKDPQFSKPKPKTLGTDRIRRGFLWQNRFVPSIVLGKNQKCAEIYIQRIHNQYLFEKLKTFLRLLNVLIDIKNMNYLIFQNLTLLYIFV